MLNLKKGRHGRRTSAGVEAEHAGKLLLELVVAGDEMDEPVTGMPLGKAIHAGLERGVR